jgi:hypothetical protein
MIECLDRFCGKPYRRKGLGMSIFELSKICMRGHRLL